MANMPDCTVWSTYCNLQLYLTHSLSFSLSLREEDEFLELPSDVSHSQQEATEDEQGVDQDPNQASTVSLPEEQSVLFTADIGK